MKCEPRQYRSTSSRVIITATVALCALLTNLAPALEITLDATAVGFIRRVPGATSKHFANEGHLTGSQGNGLLHTDNNSYFVFDLSSISGTITAAEFHVYTSNERTDVPEGGYWSSSASEELLLREVTTNVATLMNFSTAQYFSPSPEYTQLDAMFTDLGSGPLFGSVVMTEAAAEAEPGTVPGQPGGKIWEIGLTASALSSLNAASGLWALGGTLAETTPPISATTELLFGGSMPFSTVPGRATPVPQLVLTITPGSSADFDGDSDVDGRDFLIWQRGFGLTGQTNNSLGDASGNGSVGSEDLALWQAQYGAGSLSASITSVPEPTTSIIVFIAATTGAFCRRWELR